MVKCQPLRHPSAPCKLEIITAEPWLAKIERERGQIHLVYINDPAKHCKTILHSIPSSSFFYQTHDTVLHHKLCSRCNALLTWGCFLHCPYQGSHARDRTFAAQGTEASRIAANTTPNKSTLNQLKIENGEAPYTNTGGKAFGL